MDKNEVWMEKRCGRITASELGQIVSASGKVIDGNLSYVRAKRFERGHGFSLPVSARAMDIGNETEPDIFRWAVENLPECGAARFVYSKDLPEVPFWVPGDMPMFGASPDAYSEDESVVLEFKTMVGNETVEFFCDGRTCYEEKALRVFKDHGPQILGLFLSNPKVRSVVLVKYVPQRDDIMKDLDSPLAPWDSILYTFAIGLIFGNEISQLWYWIILLTHIPVDYVKARGVTPKKIGDKNALILDQVIHYLTLVLALMFS